MPGPWRARLAQLAPVLERVPLSSARLERVLYPVDSGCRSVRIAHHENIEAHWQRSEIGALLQQLARRARDALLLAPVDAGGGTAVGVARARAHLGNDQHASSTRREVDAPEAAPVSARQNPTARGAQKFRRQLFRASPALLLRSRHAPRVGC